MGEERLSDGVKVLAQTAATQGVTVRWEEFKAMPHNWPMLFLGWWQSTRCIEHWAEACVLFSHGEHIGNRAEEVDTEGQVKEVDIRELTELGPQEAEKFMRAKQASSRPWTGGQAVKERL